MFAWMQRPTSPALRVFLLALPLALGAQQALAQDVSNAREPWAVGAARVSAPVAAAVAAPVADSTQVIGTPSATAAMRGPTIAGVTVGVRPVRPSAGRSAPAILPRREETRQYKAMMIVGLAGMIAGAVIDGDAGTIVMLGSAGVGLYGLYKYLE